LVIIAVHLVEIWWDSD